jgi:iron(III) transport system ATP-binding protein
MSYFSVKNIVKSFGNTEVLHGVSFTMSNSKRVALVGKSGSGKTTILRIIAGLEIPNSGEVEIAGKKVNSSSDYTKPEDRHFGYVFQNHTLFPHLNILQNITFGISDENKGRKKEIALDYLSMLGLESKLKNYPHELSGGEKQRISIIRTLAAKPKLLLLDEPFSNLDKSTKEKLKEDLKSILDKEQIPTIMITHDAEDSFDLADRVILLDGGKIAAEGNPEELYNKPINEHSANYFSESTILERNDNQHFFEAINCNANRICIPTNSVRFKEEGQPAKITNKRFVGNGYLYEIECHGSVIKLYSQVSYDYEEINIEIDSGGIIVFE